jgi:signal transduction histidine kinase
MPGAKRVVCGAPMLHEFLLSNRAAIVTRARAKATARPARLAIDDELESGIPLFLDQLIEALGLSRTSTEALEESATKHGSDLLKRGFTVAQVVHDYGGVCQAVTELADETNVPITPDEFRFFNRYLDDSIAGAVTEYSRQRELSITAEGRERLAALAHDLRNSLGAAMLAFQSLQTGRVGPGGSTAALLGRSLTRLSGVVHSSIARVRLEAGVRETNRVSLRELVEEIEVGAAMEANARGVALIVAPVERGVDVEGDGQLLAAAVANVLRNAFRFTPTGGRVSLKIFSTPDRALIEVRDGCGGLSPEQAEELGSPVEPLGEGRTALGQGLSISRRSVAASGGTMRVRDVPGTGCVFTIDLPRLATAG